MATQPSEPMFADQFGLRRERECYRPVDYVTGRPSDYHPSYCIDVIEYGKLGKSRAWIAAELGVTRKTLWNWEQRNPVFLHAMEISQLHAQRWWEDKGESGMETTGFSAAIWSRSMSARFPNDWREKKDITANVSVSTQSTFDVRLLDKGQREQLRALLEAATPKPMIAGEFSEVEE